MTIELSTLFYILLILIFLGVTYYLMFSKKNQKLENPEFERLKLQALERMALFLERIKTDALVFRFVKETDDPFVFQHILNQNIREEFNHNLSQQIYLNSILWEQIRQAKDEVIQCVNQSSMQIKDGDNATKLAKKIVDLGSQTCDITIINTLNDLKKEIK